MSVIPISAVVTISVAQPPAGLAEYAINNLALFTKEVPLNSLPNGYAVYLDPLSVANDWGAGSETYAQANAIFNQEPNILAGGGALIVVTMAGGDTLTSKLADISKKVFFGGVIYGGYPPADQELIDAANAFQAAKVMLFASQYLTASVAGGGVFQVIGAALLSYCRMLIYTVGATQARLMAAAYAGRMMSTDFDGSNTALTANLKDLIGIDPDPGIDTTLLATLSTVGVDCYAQVGTLAKVISSGGNTYYDQVYGTLWLVYALQVAVFNALATTFSKIPQTEPGMDILRNAVLGVFAQSVNNGFAAPGSWNSGQTFGNPTDLRASVEQRGYYVYSQPINQQNQAQRVQRVAPLIQGALKLAGAIHKANVLVYLNP